MDSSHRSRNIPVESFCTIASATYRRQAVLSPIYTYDMGRALRKTNMSWFQRHKHRIGLVAFGHTAKRLEEYFFDWLLYALVVAWATKTYGAVIGSLVSFFIMAPLSALVCWFYIVFYDWLKKDWLGLETIEAMREREATAGWFMRHLIRFTKLGDIPMFFGLSIYGDPFMTTIYFRRGAHLYNGLSKRDWKIFLASVFVSNIYWILRWTILFEIIKYVWKFLVIGI